MVTGDFTRLAFLSRRKGKPLDAGVFIESLQNHLGTDGTLVIPSFNFNLRNKGRFSHSRTLPVTGSLAMEAMKRNDFARTSHPLHSFLVWGKHQQELLALDNLSSFGSDSPFALFLEHRAWMLIIETPVRDAFTFVHHVEEMEQVRYRKMKKMNLFLEDQQQWKECRIYAKKRGWTMDMTSLEKELFQAGAARCHLINQVPFTLIDLVASLPVIQQDIRENRSSGMARFDLKLYFRDAAKTVLAAMNMHTPSDKISHDPGLL